MNKLFVSLPLVLLAFVLPASASAGQAPPPGLAGENQFYCGPDAECEPPTEICVISNDEENPLPAQENCIWPDDPCLSEGHSCPPIDDSCMVPGDQPLPEECLWPDDPCIDDPKGCDWPPDPCVTNWIEDGSVPEDCDWPHDPCDLPRPWMGGVPKGESESGEIDPPKPGECEDFPPYCYVEGFPGDEGESDPGTGESGEESGWVEPPPGYWSEEDDLWREEPGDDQGEDEDQSEDEDQGSGEDDEADDPDFTVCIYDVAPLPSVKGKDRAEARKERAQARRQAARKRAQERRKAARKRAAAKRQQKKKAKAKKAAKARNS
jgi:hypothetical protein